MDESEVLVIVGPTGSGKTALAIALAQHLSAEIVSADSQQVYRGMDIGTGKATRAEQQQVPHHLLDVLQPDEEMTAARFVELADAAIATIQAKNTPVIVVGGTMLYVRALLHGLFEGPAADRELRAELDDIAQRSSSEALWDILRKVDEASAERIHKTDKRRLIRAIEVFRSTGIPLSEHHRRHQEQPPRHRAKVIGLQTEREQLYEQINRRVLGMRDAGLVAEVEGLRRAGYCEDLRSQAAIGYREIHDYLLNRTDLVSAIELIARNSRRYARRQLSWYRGDAEVQWFDGPAAAITAITA